MTDTAEAPQGAPEPEPDTDVAGAEQEAADAATFAAALESRFIQGDRVEPGQIESAEALSRWARLRVQRTRAAAERAAEAARLAAARDLAAEVEQYSADAGKEIATFLEATGAADALFRAAVDRHNAQLIEWKARAKALEVPETHGFQVPAGDPHGGLRLGRDGSTEVLQAGSRIYSMVGGEALLTAFRNQPDDRAAILAATENAPEAAR